MTLSVFIYLLGALLVITSAIPHYRDIEEKITEYGHNYKVDTPLTEHANESVDDMVDDEEIKDALKTRQSLGWWWDRTGVHNLTDGYIPATYNNIKQFSEIIIRPYKFLQIVKEDVGYYCTSGGTITYVEAYDLHTSRSSAGYASIIKRNLTHVYIRLESARNHGLKYYVRVTAVW